MSEKLTVLGFMSGTSMDGVDGAVVETDGERISGWGLAGSAPYSKAERNEIRAAVDAAQDWTKGDPAPDLVARATEIVTHKHIELAREILQGGVVDLIGFHGQTILHRPDQRWTVQIGDSALLAAELGINVVGDFRLADVAAGGQGAPFAPLYHKALVDSLPADTLPDGAVVVVNMGGVGNVTYIEGDTVLAFDTGPANGPIDDWISSQTAQSFDRDGAIAATGRIDEERIIRALTHPYFDQVPPKSLDRLDFTMELAEGLTLEDGAATLTAFSALCVAQARRHFSAEPVAWIVCGGGRHNPTLMKMISAGVSGIVYAAEDMGWRGDTIEAEAFALLAARSVKGLPLSLPTTTGVPEPMPGGVLYRA